MDVSEVLVRPAGKGVAQTKWSGCAPLEADLAVADIDKLIGLLPNRRSSNHYLGLRFSKAGARFKRYLRQDDFGPTRADQIAALTLNLRNIGLIIEFLRSLLPFQAGLLCARLDEELRPLVNLTWGQIFDAIHDISDYLGHLDPVLVDPFLELADACNRFVDFPARIDTNTAARLVDEQGNFELHLPGRPLSIADVLDWIDRFRDIHEAQRIHCRSRKGFEKSDALYFLVWELARIWSYETGEAVTHYSRKHGAYTGRPETASGIFILGAAETMLPPAEDFPKEFVKGLGKRPRIFADSRNGLPSAVAKVIKRYVQLDQKPVRPGRKRRAE
jgi:hypothetical protein